MGVRDPDVTGLMGGDPSDGPSRDGATALRERMVADIKRELQNEMGLLPLALLRDRRTSFVELYSTDNFGKTNYGTAGYLGDGYFVTVKHAVVALKDGDRPSTRKIVAIKILHDGKEIPAKLLNAQDARRQYEAIVRKNQDPALLEWMGTGMFKTSVFPVPAGAERPPSRAQDKARQDRHDRQRRDCRRQPRRE